MILSNKLSYIRHLAAVFEPQGSPAAEEAQFPRFTLLVYKTSPPQAIRIVHAPCGTLFAHMREPGSASAATILTVYSGHPMKHRRDPGSGSGTDIAV